MTLVIIISFDSSSYSQITDSKSIKLSDFLSKLSEEYKIFFTYDAKLLQDKSIDTSNFKTKNLSIIINRLRTLTNLHYDNLGNNYYVIYNDTDKGKEDLKNAKNNLISSQTKDTMYFNESQNYTINGRVIDAQGNPLFRASVLVKNTLNGTITDINGNFTLDIEPGNTVLATSFVGHISRDYYIQNRNQVTIILEYDEYLEEVQVVGSRNTNRTAVDTPSAIDVINVENATDKSGQLEINQLLQYIIPSFNASKQSGADGADHVDPATLRGLGPDQTLVLINGKRRHQSSLINLYGTRGRGNSGTDLNAIPAAAIKKIEVLRNGASAQYGSDAIAGVINIVLKDEIDVFTGNITYGLFNANAKGDYTNPTSRVDGSTIKISGNYGLKISNNGYLNLTTEVLSKDNTVRPGAEFRKKYGEAGLDEYSFFLNSEIPLNNKLNFYVHGGFSYRDSESYAFSRNSESARNVIDIYPNGFDPLITATINDQSISAGIRTKFSGWNIDINNTTGSNNFHYFIKETLNATLEEKSPTSFDAGGHILQQNTTSADFNKYYSTILKGINIAFGTEFRIENYKIFAGDAGSYAAFDINGDIVDQNTPSSDLVTLNGVIRPGGSQGFPGYSPDNEVDRSRSNLAAYIDTEFDLTDKFMIGFAGRYEKYSDFGSTFNTKFSSIFKATENFNIRSSFSTGFRAPSLAQIYYNLKFTNFIGSEPSESLLVPNDSPITRDFNIGSLIEERAINASFGFTAKINNFHATVDGYMVNIKDRIILTGNFDASSFDDDINDVQFFANGVDTNTLGLDIIFTWSKNYDYKTINLSFAGNINNMSIGKIKNKELDQETFFGTRDQFFLLASAPKSKFNFNINYRYKKLTTNVSLTHFSKIELVDWQITQATQIEDPNSPFLNEQDRFIKAKDIYNSKLTTDINTSYTISDKVTLRAGANNLFNIYPTTQQNKWTDSGGNWDAVQMGTNGSFFYTRLTYKF